jgi:hypothetical protein
MSNILLSYPRTGSSWTRYILEYFSGVAVDGHYDRVSVNKTICENGFTPLFDIDNSKFFCTMVHDASDMRGGQDDIKRLCLSFRDPTEVIPSYCYSNNHSNKSVAIEEFMKGLTVEQIRGLCNQYLYNINYFHNFSGAKHVLEYDELMVYPALAIEKLTYFFDCYDEAKLGRFMDYYEEHKQIMLGYKSMPKHMSVNTSGRVGVISKMLSSEVKEYLDVTFKEVSAK